MDPSASRFADPLKDYGFDPSSIAQAAAHREVALDETSIEILNGLVGLTGSLNLFPADPFEGVSTPGSCRSRRLDWLRDLGPNAGNSESDAYEDVYPEDLFEGASLQSKLDVFMFGRHESPNEDPTSYDSWDIPAIHPVRPSLKAPGDSGFELNANWYERIQWAYRSALPRQKSHNSLNVLGSDAEHELLLELGRFSRASCYKATALVLSILQHGLNVYLPGYISVTEDTLPLVNKFYQKKFACDMQYVHDGVVYTVVVGPIGADNAVSYTVSKKLYCNDQKGKQALCEALYSRGTHGAFAIPVQCIVDFAGIRVVAEPLVPLEDSPPIDLASELLRDCRAPIGVLATDISSCLLASSELFESFKNMSSYLHMCSWSIPFGASDICGVSRQGDADSGERRSDASNVLCDGAVANVQRCDGVLHSRQTHEVLPPILEHNATPDPLYSARFRPEFCFAYNGSLKCTLKSSSVFSDMHSGDIFHEAFKHLLVVLEDSVGRCNGLLDSWDLRQVFASLGINMRFLGMAYERAVYIGLKNLLAADMVARAVKHLWNTQLEDFFNGNMIGCDALMRRMLKLVNNVFGLYAESAEFWSQRVIPEVARHFNLVKLEGISYRVLPHLLLKSALEYHLCILLPFPSEGHSYRSPITASDFRSVDMPPILGQHRAPHEVPDVHVSDMSYNNVLDAFFPRVSVVYPQRELSLTKVASRLCGKNGDNVLADLVLATSSWQNGLCRQIESRTIGVGYPCDPACVYSSRMSCVNYHQPVTGVNLFCLSQCLLQVDPLKRSKLLLLMGYEYLRHRYIDAALECANYVARHSPALCFKRLEAQLLVLQCHCLKANEPMSTDLFESLRDEISGIESCQGLLSLQVFLFMAIAAWIRNDYESCALYAARARAATLGISGIAEYTWLPVAVVSLLGHCQNALGNGIAAIKTQREVVRLCNVSQLPRFTLCNQTWLFVEYLLRNDSHEEGCSLSMECIPILEAEFGSLSVECLRGLYVSAWSNHQVGCGHLLHPLLYLSSSDRVIDANASLGGIRGSLLLEEFSLAEICDLRRTHCANALGLYKSLYERLCMIIARNRVDILDYMRTVYPKADLRPVESLHRLTRGRLESAMEDVPVSDDELLNGMAADCEKFYEKLLLVIRNVLTLRLLSLSSAESMAVAQRLYNAYVSQVSDDYIAQMCLRSDGDGNAAEGLSRLDSTLVGGLSGRSGGANGVVSHALSMYGNSLDRQPEKFNASVSIKQNSVPHRGHELRSIEELLLMAPSISVAELCETCRLALHGSSDSPSEWFDKLFDIGPSPSRPSERSLPLFLDVLRHFLTPSKRLIILGHVASLNGVEVDSTVTFAELNNALEAVLGRHRS
ncbi:apicomplexan-conserved Pf 23619083 and Py 23490592 low complexity 1667 aa, putative [Babesia ovata]|uniref:Apicomplexan-conserved Pf 23619083 and Py 23490592 low complexity 1667 aa, putative n=1 Tax=Babesia ovata TaxID=189622 RepID=A0A2H6K6Z7_9APIC|nr:apicomplexan-conserved Pf 23619083 and Py 23490592 low complexity 1667 aa, putative [Babesia ovata]GBE58752.1 apicomplexan-conserved Pf 23619083 and Py 23490592 low complexity 1667 aa, putative [Babesia ovata]